MDFLYQLLQPYMIFIYFFYGLAFFTTGIAIALQVKKSSSLKLARSLWLLSAFALIHAFAEWAQVFGPIHLNIFGHDNRTMVQIIEAAIIALSFGFLILFGTHLLAGTRAGIEWLRFLPPVLALTWVAAISGGWWVKAGDTQSWVNMAIIWSRYLLAFPGALLTSYALKAQLPELGRLDSRQASRSCLLASYYFTFYAIVSGIIVIPAEFFPANILNTEMFFRITGIPVEIFRAMAGVLMVYSIIKTLSIFEAESRRRLEEMEKQHAIYNERHRFSQDLHDGVIQSLYAIGLNLECCRSLLEKGQLQTVETYLTDANGKMNRTIQQLRNYIHNLQDPEVGNNLAKHLMHLVEEFKGLSTASIAVIIEEGLLEGWQAEEINHIYHIVQEALYNVVKHAEATQAMLRVVPGQSCLTLLITDNGKGFDNQATDRNVQGMGFTNMRLRAAQLHGQVKIESKKGHGTEITLEIPYRGEQRNVKNNAC